MRSRRPTHAVLTALGGGLPVACAAAPPILPAAGAPAAGGLALAAVTAVLAAAVAALAWRYRKLAADAKRDRRLLAALLEASPDPVWVKDPEGRFLACNTACAEILGEPPTPAANGGAPQFPAELSHLLQQLDNAIATGQTPLACRERMPAHDGSSLLMEIRKTPARSADGSLLGLIGTARDVTDAHRRDQRLRLAAEVFDHATEGIVITDPDGVVEAVNPAFTRITGYSPDEMIGQRPSKLSSGRHDRAFYGAMWSALRGSGQWQGEIWNRRKSGEIYPEWLNISAVTDPEGQLAHYVGIFSDVSLIKSHEARLEHMAHHDALTDLPNRLLLTDRIELALRRAVREQDMIAVAFIDLDHFKDINDGHGHQVGDVVLRLAARRIVSALRDGDTVARLGGDEFVALVDHVDSCEAAEQAAHRILTSLLEPLVVDGQQLYVGASIGMSVGPRDGKSAEELIRNADTAMYQAKRRGRSMVQCYAEEQTEGLKRRARIEAGLRRALARGAFDVAYQPLVDAATGRIAGIEALARWHEEDLGEVPPSQFIPVAESSGLIVPLGEVLLRTIGRQVVAWRRDGLAPPRVAVNLSGRQLRRTDFVDSLLDILDDLGCQPDWLCIEVTEADMLDNAEHSVDTLTRLRAAGVTLSLDDFGTGFSSLSYLKRLPVQTIKIEQGFVHGIPGDANDCAIVEAVLALGHALGLNVLAEGVETEEQAAYLRARRCAQLQGFLFGAPMSAAQMGAMLDREGARAPVL